MMRRTLLLAGFLAWTYAGAALADAPRGSLLDPAYRVLVPADRAKLFFSGNSCAPLPKGLAGRISRGWTPGDEMIAAADHRLPFDLQKAIRDTHWIGPISQARLIDWESIANHTRQYAGVMLDGRKRILVVAARTYVVDFDGRHDLVHGDSWQAKPVGACDGGPDQFFAEYDPGTGAFSNFVFSGTIAGYNLP